MNDNNLTIWQRLTKTFGPNSLLNQDYPTYKFDKEELLRTKNKGEFEREKLQAQQSYYLASQWAKVENNLYTQAIYYEPSRLSAQYDYESMEYCIAGDTKIATPNGYITIKELADRGRDYEFITYAYDHNVKRVVPAIARNAHYTRDEMTYKITFDDGSHIIATEEHRFLKRDGVFEKLKDLKIGDSMMPFYRKTDGENNLIYLCNLNEEWTSENDLISEFEGEMFEKPYELTYIKLLWDNIVNNAQKHKTIERTASNLNVSCLELRNQISNAGYKKWDTFLDAYGIEENSKNINGLTLNHKIVSIEPYGVVPVYDLTVPGYKNFATDTIFSHNTPEISAALDIYAEESTTADEDGFILQIYSESKRIKGILADLFNNVLDINTNLPMWTRNTPIREDNMIPLLDGTEITIKDLSARIKNGEEIWSYAIQDNTSAIVPSKIVWCDLTRKNSELIRVTLDDGTYIDTTPDHEYMLRNGSFKRADELKTGQSLMPFYTKKSVKPKDRIDGYEKVYNPSTGRYKFTHSMVSHECVRDLEYEKTINENFDTHHIDFVKINNHPNNLKRLTRSEHFKLHTQHYEKTLGTPENIKKRMEGIFKYLKSEERREFLSKKMKGSYPYYFEQYNNSELHKEHNVIRSNKMLKNWKNPDFIKKTKNGMIVQISDECINYIGEVIKKYDNFIGLNNLSKILKKDETFVQLVKESYTLRKNAIKSINPTTLRKIFKRKGFKTYTDFVTKVKPEIVNDFGFKKSISISEGKLKQLNHKVVSVEKLTETSDVYCLEAVGPNGEHDRHNFPVCSKDNDGKHTRNGVFLANCKFGDNFVFLKLDPEKGVVGCQQLPTIEIERMESGTLQRTTSDPQILEDKKPLTFEWKNKAMSFQSWEVAHFRLLGDDRKLPYGTCLKYDTKIDTEYGFKLIKDIEIGDNVYSFDLKTERRVLSKVLDVVNSGIKVCYEIKTENSFIEASEEHKILIFNGKEFIYKNVLDLKVGDNLVLDNFSWDPEEKTYEFDPILSINKIGEYETYDIYVENENHNFYANGLVVHNSMLEKARRIWKQLLLSEDAMLIYRVSRAPERRIFKVFVGNMNDEDIEPYVQRVADKFKRSQVVDSKSGNVDLRFNQMAVDQDYFIPVRDPAAPSPIETLAGAQNLSEIADIEYIQKKLLTALRVPKAFLGFEEVVGDGKDLALQDIRFARTINRIQKSMLQELNKIAIIHLFVLGFEDELTNFSLNLTNPSSQSDLLKIDIWKEKVALYKELVTDPGNGISASSSTWAKKHIFGWSDDDVKLDLQQQRIERAVGEELKGTPTVIVKTGIFDNVDKLYGSTTGGTQTAGTETGTDMGGDMGIDMGAMSPPPPAGGDALAPEGGAPPPPEAITPESTQKDMNILLENDLIQGKKVINLGNGQKSLKEISKELDKLLNT